MHILLIVWPLATQVYLDAWNYVKSLLPNATAGAGSALPAVKELVENWTNPEFVRFVDVLGDLVNRSVSMHDARSDVQSAHRIYRLSIVPGTPAFLRAEEIWARVVELEEAFWPVGGEELAALSV